MRATRGVLGAPSRAIRARHDRGQAVRSHGLTTPPGREKSTDVGEPTSVVWPGEDARVFGASLPNPKWAMESRMIDELAAWAGNMSRPIRATMVFGTMLWLLIVLFGVVLLHIRKVKRLARPFKSNRTDLVDILCRTIMMCVSVLLSVLSILFIVGAVGWLFKSGSMSAFRAGTGFLIAALGSLLAQFVEYAPQHWVRWLDDR